MESVYPELVLCGSKNLFSRTDTVLLPISEISKGTVSLLKRRAMPNYQLSSGTKSLYVLLLGLICLGFLSSSATFSYAQPW